MMANIHNDYDNESIISSFFHKIIIGVTSQMISKGNLLNNLEEVIKQRIRNGKSLFLRLRIKLVNQSFSTEMGYNSMICCTFVIISRIDNTRIL